MMAGGCQEPGKRLPAAAVHGKKTPVSIHMKALMYRKAAFLYIVQAGRRPMTEDQLERDTLAWLQDVGYPMVASGQLRFLAHLCQMAQQT